MTFDLALCAVQRWVGELALRLRNGCDLLLVWQERSRQRRRLTGLNDHMLRDIGLTRADVMAEASKPFWRL